MSPCPSLEELALSLDEPSAHTAECASCGFLLQQLQQDREQLRHAPELPADAYDQVRGAVMSRISGAKSRTTYWIAFASAAAALLIAIVWPEPPAPVIAVSAPPPPAVAATRPAETAAATTATTTLRRARIRRPVVPRNSGAELIAALDAMFDEAPVSAPGAPGQTVVTLTTDDPTVTILLLDDTKGEDE